MRTLSSALVVVGLVVGCAHTEPVASPPPPPPPPPVATCDQVAVHTHALLQPKYGDDPDKLQHLTAIVQERCTTDAWAPTVRTCVMGTQSLEDGHHCIDGMPPAQRELLMKQMDDASRAPKAQPIASGNMPPSCVEYRAMMEAYANCPSVPPDARAAIKQSFEQAWSQWAAMPPEAREPLEGACRQAADAIKQALETACNASGAARP